LFLNLVMHTKTYLGICRIACPAIRPGRVINLDSKYRPPVAKIWGMVSLIFIHSKEKMFQESKMLYTLHTYVHTHVYHIDHVPWRRGIGVIASVSRTDSPGFESRLGVRFLGLYTFQCYCHDLMYLRKINAWKKFLKNYSDHV
jgi:hypothetical protein